MPINIVISDKDVQDSDFNLPANGGSEPIEAQRNATDSLARGNDGSIVRQSVYASMIANAGMNQARSLLDYSLNHYGDFTGNYEAQSRMQTHISNIGMVASIAGGVGQIGLGLATFNPVAVVGGALQLGSLAINKGIESFEYARNISKSNAVATYNARRIGTILTNGNR